MLHKIALIFVILLLLISFCFTSFAEGETSSNSTNQSSTESKPDAPKGDFTVQVDTVQANAGDTVIVKLRVINNPGIMAMTISITYDSSVLEFKQYYYGKVFSDYTLKEHPNRNIIRLVISEEEDIYGDGAIIGIRFKIADNAEAKLHDMTVEYTSGDFCNNDLVRLMPKITPGGVEVAYNGSNCGHRNYSEWTESIAPTCTAKGAEQRTCTKCGHVELRDTAPTGHDFEDKWTVDIPATKDSAGTMSRHCKYCTATTDETNFTLEHSEEGDIENVEDGSVPDNDVTSSIIEEQHPEINEDKENSSNNPTSSEDTTTSQDNNSSENSSASSKPQNGSSDKTDSSKKPESSKDETSSKNNNSSSKDNNTSSKDENEDSDKKPLTEEEKTEEQIKDIIEIISPDKSEEEKAEIVVSVNQKLREVFPQIDSIIKIFRICFILIIAFVLI